MSGSLSTDQDTTGCVNSAHYRWPRGPSKPEPVCTYANLFIYHDSNGLQVT